jgi:ABC transporter substrate binding protein
MFEELRRSGFIEGRNLTVDWHEYGQRVELVSKFAAELVKARVDVIAAGGDFGIRAAQQATATIPIIGFTDDMIGSRLVNSLARPGGNTTGISLLATELDGKRQEILIEAVPGLRRMAALADTDTTAPRQLQALQDAARGQYVECGSIRSLRGIDCWRDFLGFGDPMNRQFGLSDEFAACPLLPRSLPKFGVAANRRVVPNPDAAKLMFIRSPCLRGAVAPALRQSPGDY